jgi:tetratricopeptide (TPR) repeat protein
VQGDIAERVAAALDVELGGAERAALAAPLTASFEAYNLYLQGVERRMRNTEEDLRAAAGLLERAIALDPRFAMAHVRLFDAHFALYTNRYDRTGGRLARAKTALDHAFRVAPALAAAHVRAAEYGRSQGDFDGAAGHLARATELEPNNSDAWTTLASLQWARGQWHLVPSSLARAVAVDPRARWANEVSGDFYTEARRYPEAERFYERALALAPDDPHLHAAKAELDATLGGRPDTARAVLREAIRRLGLERVATASGGPIFFSLLDSTHHAALDTLPPAAFGIDTTGYLEWKASWSAHRGQVVRGRAYDDSLRRRVEREVAASPSDVQLRLTLSRAHTRLGQGRRAVGEARRALDAAIALKDVKQLVYLLSVPSPLSKERLRLDPRWAPLRGHPGFERLAADR